MNVREFLMDYLLNHSDNHNDKGEPFTDDLTEFFYEIGSDWTWDEQLGSSRWWDNLFVVQEINGKLIGYEWAATTGDRSARDRGWEFNENSICFVEPYTETITVTKYREIK